MNTKRTQGPWGLQYKTWPDPTVNTKPDWQKTRAELDAEELERVKWMRSLARKP